MPPRSALRDKTGNRKEAPAKAAVAAPVAVASSVDDQVRALAIAVFQEVQKSSGCHNAQKKKLMKGRADLAHTALLTQSLASLVLSVLSMPSISPEAVSRVAAFLKEYCIECRKVDGSDAEAVLLIKAVMPSHNAADKTVRARVLLFTQVLVETLDGKVRTPARSAFYDTVVDVAKHRMHDKHPDVVIKAVRMTHFFLKGTTQCDVTQHLLGLLCVHDTASVRASVIAALTAHPPSDEIAPHLVRCISDKSPLVRKAAWEGLSKLKWNRFATYAGDTTLQCLYLGVTEMAPSVQTSVGTTLRAAWVTRDCDNCVDTMLSKLDFSLCMQTDVVVAYLLNHVKHLAPAKCAVKLNLANMTSQNTLLWRMAFEADEENRIEVELFSQVITACTAHVMGKDQVKGAPKVTIGDVDSQGLLIDCLYSSH